MVNLKKNMKVLLAFGLVISFLFSPLGSTANACYLTSCSKTKPSNVHSTHNISVYYSKSQVNKIVARHNSLGSNKTMIISYILSMRNPSIGLGVLMYNIGSNNMIKPFKTAKRKKTGLKISYKVTVYKGSNALTKVSNKKYSYQ